MTSTVALHHTEWLSLVETSGPFLTLPVLERVLPQGLDPVETELADEVRRAYEEWRADPDLHGVWIRWVLAEVLGFDGESLKEGPAIPPTFSYTSAEHGETLRPNLVLLDPTSQTPKGGMLIAVWPEGIILEDRLPDRRWVASPLDRMTELLRATGVRLGLVTNGERWTLVHAPAGRATTYASWEASLWIEERITLAAFRTLLAARRFFAVAESETIEALFEESANAEQEVTNQLGRQVRQAVELLVDTFGRADREHWGELLGRIGEEDLQLARVQNREQLLYLAAVTVMMRLVFLLCAEERKLFPLDDDLYNQSYAASTLHAQLQEEADRFGEEPLERRSSAWYRLLAAFRMVHGGVQHEDLRIPPYGGSLFDPDRFPFLEGRRPGVAWQVYPGRPLPVDDRTVLHILDALQVLRFRGRRGVTEARRLSFRALDVEQIGHVYEGLLDHAAVYVTDPALGLEGPLEAEVALEELEERTKGDRPVFVAWLVELTGRTSNAIEKALAAQLPREQSATLLAACDNDPELANRIAPFHALLRKDLRGLPQVYVSGSVYVTKAAERRTSGTYYTPRSLAEEMVRYALEPVVYYPGPTQGADPKDWKLIQPAELLKLKVCDMAMGSGAFLVAACRYLADRLVEAWESTGQSPITVEGQPSRGDGDLMVPDDPADRVILARRLVADRCLYGVDKNPVAVEMAKLSIWLVTLAKDRPFSFLDHSFKCGDSLLGIHDLAQIEHLHMDPARGRELHTTLEQHWRVWEAALQEAIEGRRKLESFTVLTIRDAEFKERLFQETEDALDALKVVGDLVVGAALSTARQGPDALDSRLLDLAPTVAAALDPKRKPQDREARLEGLRTDAIYWLNESKPLIQPDRRTFHWPLEFPEVFFEHGGFNSIIGNPPFLGGTRISGPLGADYRAYLGQHIAGRATDRADLVAFFFLTAARVARARATVAMLATNTISEADTKVAALDQLLDSGWASYRAVKSRPWPGTAGIEIAQVWLYKADWSGHAFLNGNPVARIGSDLQMSGRATGRPYRLRANVGLSFEGTTVYGEGFVLTPAEAESLLQRNPRNSEVLMPYLSGEDLMTNPTQSPSRWVINLSHMTLEEAKSYPDCFEVLQARVWPGRRARRTSRYRNMAEHWWWFLWPRKELYKAIAHMDRVIVLSKVSKSVMPIFVRTGPVLSNLLAVIVYDDWFHLGLLTSEIHRMWALRMGSTLETRPRYTTTDCFETFPQPKCNEDIAWIAKAVDEHRRAMMLERNEGLTRTYNRVHAPDETVSDVAELRKLHVELDHAVAAAYGWADLGLNHGFHDTFHGPRFTIGPVARVEILDRLLELNHERYRQEVAAGLHVRKVKVRRPSGSSPDGLTLEVPS